MFLPLCQSAIKGILRKMSLLNVILLGLLPRVECIAALMAYIAMDKASLMYSFGTSHVLVFFVVVHTSLMWQFCNKVWKISLEFSMVLLGPRYILQMGLIGLQALVRIHIPCHLIWFSGKSHSWGCQPFDVDLYDNIFVMIVHEASCFLYAKYADVILKIQPKMYLH